MPDTINVLRHTHRHGTNIVLFRGGDKLPIEQIAARLELDYEDDRDDEELEHYEFAVAEIPNVDELPDPPAEDDEDDEEEEA